MPLGSLCVRVQKVSDSSSQWGSLDMSVRTDSTPCGDDIIPPIKELQLNYIFSCTKHD